VVDAVSARYFSWRVALNVLAYMAMWPVGEARPRSHTMIEPHHPWPLLRALTSPGLRALSGRPIFDLRLHASGSARPAALVAALRLPRHVLRAAAALTLTAIALVVDALVGLIVLQLPMLIAAALCEALLFASRGHVALDRLWFLWLHSQRELKPTPAEWRAARSEPEAQAAAIRRELDRALQRPSDAASSADMPQPAGMPAILQPSAAYAPPPMAE
jgi:hypothetical protein